jgi:hypothetical protein
MGRYLDPDAPLAPPTVRSLIPAHVWAWDVINLTQAEFDALPLGKGGCRPDGFVERPGAMYRSTTARYGERVGAWEVNRVVATNVGLDGDNTEYQFLLVHIDGKPLIEDFADDPYHNLALRKS